MRFAVYMGFLGLAAYLAYCLHYDMKTQVWQWVGVGLFGAASIRFWLIGATKIKPKRMKYHDLKKPN